MTADRILLASRSKARVNMLESCGLEFESIPADIDEDAITQSMQGAAPKDIALKLASEKALKISNQHPDALVIGSDQVLECEGQLFSKSADIEEAKDKLRLLSGKDHHLISGVAVVKNGAVLWQDHDQAALTMHDLTEDDITRYTEQAGEALTRAVGGYELESHGAWLFKAVEGDYFTVLGMPLLKLLNHLREYDE